MKRDVRLIALLLAQFAVAGCSQSPTGGAGVTYEDIETDEIAAQDAGSDASTSVTGETGQATDMGSETADASTGDVDPDEDIAADSGTETVVSPAVVTDPPDDPGVSQAAASTVTLTPEQEAQLAGVELTPEQWASLAGIQLQPDYFDKIFFVVDGAQRIQFDDLDLEKVLNMTYIPPFATDYFPPWMQDLDGKRVRLRGFMYTTFDDVDQFLLCRDLGPCCFGPNPRADYRIPVHLQAGETTDYIHQIPFDVVGTFHIHLTIDDLGRVGHTYAMSEATIIRL